MYSWFPCISESVVFTGFNGHFLRQLSNGYRGLDAPKVLPPVALLRDVITLKSTVFSGLDRLPHGWNVLASIFVGGAVTALAYALSSAGLAEIAGTFLSFWGVFVFTRLFAKLAAGRSGHFAGTSALLRQVQADVNAWVRDRTTLSLFVIGAGAAAAYVAWRSACIALLGVFSNVWFALAGGLLLAAVIASPVLFRDLGRLMASDSAPAPGEGVGDGDAPESIGSPAAPEGVAR